MEGLVHLLEKRGVRVDRPNCLNFNQRVMTPEWSQDSMFGCMSPRDLLITVGTEMLEATMSYRSRWFEYLCYRNLLEDYFHTDQNMKWEAAPKPRLTDASYHAGFWDEYEPLPRTEKIARVRRHELILTEVEPLFDAADIARFGRDLFVQRSMVTNRAGIRWLRSHFPGHRIHEVSFDWEMPVHIDATLVPLRPGLVLHCADRPAEPGLLRYFKANDWEVVESARPSRDHRPLPPLCYCSKWLSMNLLSLDPKTICIEESEHAQAEQLYGLGFEVLPLPFWDVAPFGGSLHCATVDVWRDGTMEDYFPQGSPTSLP